jgi:anti-anti-sigma regulatory factor
VPVPGLNPEAAGLTRRLRWVPGDPLVRQRASWFVLSGSEAMMVMNAFDRADARGNSVRCEGDEDIVRVVVGGVLTDATAATVREMLLDACERGTKGVVLTIEAELDPMDPTVLGRLMDMAQRRCWAASRRFEVTATDAMVCEALAAMGIWPSTPSGSPG